MWRAARAVNDHDLNSFLVRIDPIKPAEGIEPGMSAWIENASRAAQLNIRRAKSK